MLTQHLQTLNDSKHFLLLRQFCILTEYLKISMNISILVSSVKFKISNKIKTVFLFHLFFVTLMKGTLSIYVTYAEMWIYFLFIFLQQHFACKSVTIVNRAKSSSDKVEHLLFST